MSNKSNPESSYLNDFAHWAGNNPNWSAGYKGSSTDIYDYQKMLSEYNEDSGEFNPYDIIDQSMYKNTARGKMAYQEDLAKLLYLAQINQENRMNEYNSPSEQVKRMREAGINPDIVGVENMGATNVAGYQGNPMDGTKSTLDSITDIFGLITSASSMAMSMVSGFSSISMDKISKFSSALSAGDALFGLFDKAILSDNGNNPVFFGDFLPSLSRSERKHLKRAYNSYVSSTKGDTSVNKALAEYVRSQGEYNKESLNPFNSASEDVIAEVWKPYIDAMAEYAVKELKGKSAKADYDSSYYSSEFGKDSQDFEKQQRDLFRQFKQPLIDVMKNIDNIPNDSVREALKASLATLVLKFLPL